MSPPLPPLKPPTPDAWWRTPTDDRVTKDRVIDVDAHLFTPCSPVPDDPAFRLAIVCMTKRPVNFETWLAHHREHVGVARFYLRVEDTPWLEPFLAQQPWCDCVTATYARCTLRDWSDQTERQRMHVIKSVTHARNDGMTHLLHVDDDELLCCPQGGAALRDVALAAGPGRDDLHALNLEALVPGIECENPFREACVFRHRISDFCAYGGPPHSTGKSIGVLAHASLTMAGPHHFWRLLDDDALTAPKARDLVTCDSPTQLVLPPNVAVVIHYESATYQKWLDKFTDYARRMRIEGQVAIKLARTFSTFYQSSIHACAQRSDASTQQDIAFVGHYSADDAEEHCRTVWRDNKVAPSDMPTGLKTVAIDAKRGLTCMPPLAAALGPLKPARPIDAVAPRLEEPSHRHWRVCHTTACWVREAPTGASGSLDLRLPGALVEADCETVGEGGRWVRLREAFENGKSGWMLIDGTHLGFGLLLEPFHGGGNSSAQVAVPPSVVAAPAAAALAAPATAPPAAVDVMDPTRARPSITDVIQHAGLAERSSAYVAKLIEAGESTTSLTALECTSAELTAMCRRARLPVGHRLSLVNALEKLRLRG